MATIEPKIPAFSVRPEIKVRVEPQAAEVSIKPERDAAVWASFFEHMFSPSVVEQAYIQTVGPDGKLFGTKKKLEAPKPTPPKPVRVNGWLKIKKVVYNAPATIIFWNDGTKTIVKCQPGDAYSKETGLAMAIVKKACGNSPRYNKLFHRWVNGDE